jgi:hypothetical protein
MHPHPKRTENPKAPRPTVKGNDMDGLVAAAWDAGWWCERTADGHVMCYSPNLDDRVLASRSKDPRAFKKSRAQFRRAGLEI